MRTVLLIVASFALAASTSMPVVVADESPPTKAEVIALMEQGPLTQETWPAWRDYYVRLFYAYEIDESDEFYTRLYAFLGDQADQNQGNLIGEFADDPIAGILLSRCYIDLRADSERAEEACRNALAIGDPSGMSTLMLVDVLLMSVRLHEPNELTSEEIAKLQEAEKHLELIEQTVPQAKLSIFYGLLAWNRNEIESAVKFLKQATIDHPNSSLTTFIYLSAWLDLKTPTRPMTATTAPCAGRFPDNPRILAIHALALYADDRRAEAFETLQKARRLDESAAQILGDVANAAIDEGRWITPVVSEGLQLQKQNAFRESIFKFEKELNDNPDNSLAARLLARSLVYDISNSSDGQLAATRCQSLCEKFPEDAELHLARAIALSWAGRPVEANKALLRSQELGGDIAKMADASHIRKIRDDAHQAESSRVIRWICGIGLATVAGWIVTMFGVGAVLARLVSLQADPDPLMVYENHLSSREIWVERTYLLVLTLGLIFFYASLPIVCLGLLSITLALFLMMLALRIVHTGILYRGYFAVAGVIRSATIGPSREILGIEIVEAQHPRLFEVFTEVADRLQTRIADSVYLTPLPEISVHDSGNGPFGLFGKRRVIQIGIPTFSSLTVSELKSVLAHEFAHFSHQHTFYTRFIFQVSAPLSHSLAVMSAAGGAFNYINPFYGFYWLYLKGFELLAAGFSRSHEFLADRRSAFAYGKDLFRSSLAKVTLEGNLFQSLAVTFVKHGLSHGRAFINIFEAVRQYQEQPEGQELRQRVLDDILKEKPGWYHSHPTYSERARAVESIPNSQHPTDLVSSTKLLDDIEAIESQLTDMLTQHISEVCEIMDVPDHLRAN